MTLRTSMRNALWSVIGRSGLGPLLSNIIHSRASLRVLMYHDVPATLIPVFESHLKWLIQHFEFLTPRDLLSERKIGQRPKALLTFDDGCIDNYELVAPLLESYGLRGLFFVCPGFAERSRETCFEFMKRSSTLLGEQSRDSRWQRMSRQQIIDLDRRGHGIGSHTMTHTPLTKVDQSEALREVRDSAVTLESWLGRPCSFFAWTYSWDGITSESLDAAANCHPFCFSPCSGLNGWPQPSRLFWRTGVDVSKPVSHLQTQVCGIVDRFYKKQRIKLSTLWDLRTCQNQLTALKTR